MRRVIRAPLDITILLHYIYYIYALS
jgi:hypothetical protein